MQSWSWDLMYVPCEPSVKEWFKHFMLCCVTSSYHLILQLQKVYCIDQALRSKLLKLAVWNLIYYLPLIPKVIAAITHSNSHKYPQNPHKALGGDILLHCFLYWADECIVVPSAGSLITAQIKSLITSNCRYISRATLMKQDLHLLMNTWMLEKRDQQWWEWIC